MSEDGIKDITLHLPQVFMETVDISFDYPRCTKKYKKITPWLKVPYPHCSKTRKVIKFDVPRIRWETTSIKIPLVKDAGEIIKNIQGSIDALKEILDAVEQDFSEAEAMLKAQLEVAKKYGPASAISQIEEELEELAEEKKQVLKELQSQISELESEKSSV